MDADLQDDISAVAGMIAAFEAGAHLALGARDDHTADSVHKQGWARGYYRPLSLLGMGLSKTMPTSASCCAPLSMRSCSTAKSICFSVG